MCLGSDDRLSKVYSCSKIDLGRVQLWEQAQKVDRVLAIAANVGKWIG
jgi:hypothetical protein